ncbi:hypothetical protein [Flavobacterium soli]|uniref:hypothetical protein n=1 Tax=Flavobacterium soli TaxID=344881 RepID=UPI0004205C57|nr:hypothetical protein [Flavobacterium soli]
MNTTTLPFPTLENEFLAAMLRQAIAQHPVCHVFHTPRADQEVAQLTVEVADKAIADQLQQQPWVAKALLHHQTNVCFFYTSQLQSPSYRAHPYVLCYCQPNALLYRAEGLAAAPLPTLGRKGFKKKWDRFTEQLQHDHELYQVQLQQLQADGFSHSLLATYERLLIWNTEQLERLHTGRRHGHPDLNSGILQLFSYLPELQRHFVAKSPKQLYLPYVLDQARKCGFEQDMYYGEALLEAIAMTENTLFEHITQRLSTLKRRAKKRWTEAQHPVAVALPPNDPAVAMAIRFLSQLAEVEQAYLFHQLTCGANTTYYLLLIGKGLGNERLESLTQSLHDRTEGKADFMLLGHERYWIQKNLYQYQQFFVELVQEQQLVYSSSQYHPDFHWELPHHPYHGDLHFYGKATRDAGLQFASIVQHNDRNYQGLKQLFALFFLSLCRTLIFVSTFYLPHYLSSKALWQLCVYADPALRKHEYLFAEFSTDFFSFADQHRSADHRLSRLTDEQVGLLQRIVEGLMAELPKAEGD